MTVTESAIAARPKIALVALMAVAFLFGATAGAIAMKNYAFRSAHHAQVDTELREDTLARWQKKLDLTPDQTGQIRMILDDFNKYYANVLGEGHDRIMHVLTPEQKEKFQKMVQETY